MDAVRLGSVCRALRIKKQWRQADLAARAGVSRTAVSDLETGRIGRTRVDEILRVVDALGGRIDFLVRWQGGDLNRPLKSLTIEDGWPRELHFVKTVLTRAALGHTRHLRPTPG